MMLKGKTVTLREIREPDIELLWKWKNDPTYYEFFYELIPVTLEQHKKWIERVTSDKTEIIFAISNTTDDRCIGTVGFQHVDLRNRKAEWGRLLIGDKQHSPKGSGKEVESLMLEYAFEHLGLNKLYCEVLSSNDKVVSLHKRFGFVEEGLFKNHVFKNGEFKDVVFLAMYASKYFSSKENIKNLNI